MSAKLPRERDHLVEPLFEGLRREVEVSVVGGGRRWGGRKALVGVLILGALAAGVVFLI